MFNTQAVYYKELDKVVHMDKMCSYRYLIYIESYGWSASLKHRLACGSVLFQGVALVNNLFTHLINLVILFSSAPSCRSQHVRWLDVDPQQDISPPKHSDLSPTMKI